MNSRLLRDIYLFHPACEMAVANGTNSFQPNQRIRQFASDLQSLPAYLMKETDFLLVEKNSVERCRQYFQHNDSFQQILSFEELLQKAKDDTVRLGALRPWGWSPVLHKKLTPLKPYLSESFSQSVVGEWKPGYKPLFSRLFALQLLTTLIRECPASYYIESSLLAVSCGSIAEVKQQLRNHHKIVLKAPYSASGRGIQVVSVDNWRPFHEQWIAGVISRQGRVMVEPHLHRSSDLGFQFHINDQGEVRSLGLSFFKTDETGQYIGNYLGLVNHPQAVLNEIGFSLDQLYAIGKKVQELISRSEISCFHRGYLGVDALVFVDKRGRLRINPILEINLRSTMGTVAISLEDRYLSDSQAGFMGIHFSATGSFSSFVKERQQRNGFSTLTPIESTTQFGAWMQVDG